MWETRQSCFSPIVNVRIKVFILKKSQEYEMSEQKLWNFSRNSEAQPKFTLSYEKKGIFFSYTVLIFS